MLKLLVCRPKEEPTLICFVYYTYSGCGCDYLGYSSKPSEDMEKYRMYGRLRLDKDKVIILLSFDSSVKFCIILPRNEVKIISSINAGHLLPPEKHPMLMMIFGFLQGLITNPLLNFVEAQSLPQATSKEA